MKLLFKKVREAAVIPSYQTAGSAAVDLTACLDEPLTLLPNERKLIPTGIAIQLPSGYEAQLRARSGLSLKHGITLANGVGTIDSDYRGEIGAIVLNAGEDPFVIIPGMRIAQLVIAKYEQVEYELVEQLSESKRGEGGYGSTGH